MPADARIGKGSGMGLQGLVTGKRVLQPLLAGLAAASKGVRGDVASNEEAEHQRLTPKRFRECTNMVPRWQSP
jgi:hypothetical protein